MDSEMQKKNESRKLDNYPITSIRHHKGSVYQSPMS